MSKKTKNQWVGWVIMAIFLLVPILSQMDEAAFVVVLFIVLFVVIPIALFTNVSKYSNVSREALQKYLRTGNLQALQAHARQKSAEKNAKFNQFNQSPMTPQNPHSSTTNFGDDRVGGKLVKLAIVLILIGLGIYVFLNLDSATEWMEGAVEWLESLE